MLAYQLPSFLLYAYLYAKLLHMPAADSILSISLYAYSLVQSFIWACYMPVYMPSIHYAKSFVFAYINQYICNSARFSMPVEMLSTLYLLICQVLYPICYVLYAGYHMPRLICQFLYIECHVLVVTSLQSDQLICLSQYQFLHALCYMLDLRCQLQYTCIYMPAQKCQISVVRCQVSLYANLCCFMSISVYMPSALFQELYAECFVLYAKFAYIPVAVCLHLYAGTWVPNLFYELSS
jgi:hypothetical protein